MFAIWRIRGALLCQLACMAAAVTGGASAVASLDQLAASPGLQNPCRQAIQKLSTELDGGSTRIEAMLTVTQAAVATGRIMEALPLLNAGYSMGMMGKFRMQDAFAMAPFLSPGSPDSCAYIQGFHYCRIDLASIFLRFGVCVPSACGAGDVAILVNNTYHNHDVTQGVFGSAGNQWLTPKLPLEESTRCGPSAYGFRPTTGTYVMAALTAVLAILAALATCVEWLWNCQKMQPKERADSAESDASHDGAPLNHPGAARRWYERDGMLMESLLCWSVSRNLRALIAKQRGGSFDSLDGIRALSATWIVFCHVYVYGLLNLGYTNLYDMFEARGHRGVLATYAGQAIMGGSFAVDTFLFIAAFLAVYLMLKALQRAEKRRSWSTCMSSALIAPRIYVLRYLRLTPAYAYVLFVYWHVLRVADKGPFFTAVFEPEYAVCKRSWYKNLLYFNNSLNLKEGICFGPSWYLALDFQLFLVTPFVAGLAYWRHTSALSLLAICVVASVTWAYVGFVRGWGPMDTMDEKNMFFQYYMRPWFRAPPYLVGMAVAIVWHAYLGQQKLQKTIDTHHLHSTPRRFSACLDGVRELLGGERARVWAGPALLYVSLLLFGVLILGGRGFMADVDHPWTQGRMIQFLTLTKPAWSVALACLTLSLFTGHGGWIKSTLESRALTIISRLTYCVYLVHVGVAQWFYAVVGPMHWSGIWCTVVYLGVLGTALLLATVVYLLVESPVRALINLLTSQGGQPTRQSCKSDRMYTDKSDIGDQERGSPVKLCVPLQPDFEAKCDQCV